MSERPGIKIDVDWNGLLKSGAELLKDYLSGELEAQPEPVNTVEPAVHPMPVPAPGNTRIGRVLTNMHLSTNVSEDAELHITTQNALAFARVQMTAEEFAITICVLRAWLRNQVDPDWVTQLERQASDLWAGDLAQHPPVNVGAPTPTGYSVSRAKPSL